MREQCSSQRNLHILAYVYNKTLAKRDSCPTAGYVNNISASLVMLDSSSASSQQIAVLVEVKTHLAHVGTECSREVKRYRASNYRSRT